MKRPPSFAKIIFHKKRTF